MKTVGSDLLSPRLRRKKNIEYGVGAFTVKNIQALPSASVAHVLTGLDADEQCDFYQLAGNNVYKAVFESKEPPDKIISDFSVQCADFPGGRLKYLFYLRAAGTQAST